MPFLVCQTLRITAQIFIKGILVVGIKPKWKIILSERTHNNVLFNIQLI